MVDIDKQILDILRREIWKETSERNELGEDSQMMIESIKEISFEAWLEEESNKNSEISNMSLFTARIFWETTLRDGFNEYKN